MRVLQNFYLFLKCTTQQHNVFWLEEPDLITFHPICQFGGSYHAEIPVRVPLGFSEGKTMTKFYSICYLIPSHFCYIRNVAQNFVFEDHKGAAQAVDVCQ